MVKLKATFSLEKDGLTQSLILAFMSCRRYFLHKICRWDKAGEPLFGNLCHHVLDKAASLKSRPTLKQINNWVDDYKPRSIIPADELELERTKCAAVMDVYFDIYASDYTLKKFRKAEGVVAVKYGRILLRGKIDMQFHDKQGKMWHKETKTTSRMDEESLMYRLHFDFQNLYYLHLKKLLTGTLPCGVIYDIIRNPQTRKAANKKQLFEQVQERARAEADHFFKRYEIKYTLMQYEGFIQELDMMIEDIRIALTCQSNNHFYKNPSHCTSGFNCTFLESCATGGKSGNYIQNDTIFPELEA